MRTVEDILAHADIGLCWTWTRSLDKAGYANVWWEGGARRGHRVVWQLLVGPIPDGIVLDHLCRNHACVNPDHLEPVTGAVNIARGYRAKQTHCTKCGNPYDGERVNPNGKVYPRCLTCHREHTRRWRAGSGTLAA